MEPNTYNFYALILGIITVILSAATLGVVYWYTRETQKMQIAVTRQSEELARQVRLSIMPAFVLEFSFIRDGTGNLNIKTQQLRNVGNGTAISLAILPFAMEHSVNHVGSYAFEEIQTLGENQTAPLEHTEASLPRFTGTEVKSKTFSLVLAFQDIEGNHYRQKLVMDKGICRPQAVAALTSAEIDLQNKVLAEQETHPPINSYR